MSDVAAPRKLGFRFKVALAIATGCLEFLACATFDIWPLAWIGFVPLLYAIRDETPRRAFLLGWIAGTVGNAGGFYWITILLLRFGQMGWGPAIILFILLVAYQGLHWGAFAYLLRYIHRRGLALPATLLAPLLMAALELLMPFIFDWYLSITQAWVLPVIQLAELAGPIGVTALIMLVNGMLYDVLDTRLLARPRRPLPWRPLAIGAAVLVAALVFGFVRIAQVDARRAKAEKIKIGLVQANIGIVTKGRAELAHTHHQLHLRESRKLIAQGAELLVWPESSYPYAMYRQAKHDWPASDRRRIMDGIDVPLLFGALSLERGEPYPYNSAFMMMPDGRITGRFDKNFLLIFGEYIPFYELIPGFKRWFPAASNFARGKEVTTFELRGKKIAPLICYEDILPAFGRRLAKLEPNLLVNITNDAWFGSTSEPYEHLALAVFRAVELRLDLVRAVNTGVSAFIDATGRVGNKTRSYDPVVTPGVPPVGLLGESAFLDGGPTVYALVGNLFAYLALLASVVFVVIARRRRPSEPAAKKTKGRGKRGRVR